MKRKAEEEPETDKSTKWDDILCSICMEHPHNAVILRCSSYSKGCRAYVCDSDTSHMLSNCLNRFVKQRSVHTAPPSLTSVIYRNNLQLSHLILLSGGEENFNLIGNEDVASGRTSENNDNSMLGMHLAGEEYLETEYSQSLHGRIASHIYDPTFSCQPGMNMKCPMCRGVVASWEDAVEGRERLNSLNRNCSHDSCAFSGNYHELCQHAWIKHCGANSIKIDPTREKSWHRLERQIERDDIVNALQSETPGAVLHGDFAIERDELSEDVARDDQTLDAIYVHQSTNAIASNVIRQLLFSSTHQQVVEPPLEPMELLWAENLLGLRLHHAEDIIELHDNSNINISTDVDGALPPAPRRQEN